MGYPDKKEVGLQLIVKLHHTKYKLNTFKTLRGIPSYLSYSIWLSCLSTHSLWTLWLLLFHSWLTRALWDFLSFSTALASLSTKPPYTDGKKEEAEFYWFNF